MSSIDDEQLHILEQVEEKHLPMGDWAGKPAVPATTVPATNTTEYRMWVEINLSGATVTAVKVDGVTVGSRTSGMFLVRPGSTIAITYSAGNPTWQWFYA